MSTPIHSPLCLRPGALDVPTPDVDPSRWNGITMEADEFHALPRVPGYKYELIDGTARIRPVDSPLILLAIRTDDVPAQTRPSVPTTVRPLAPNDQDALVTLWADIFVERPDYGRVDRDHIRADAQKQIDALLDNSEGANATCSRVALRDGTVVGGLLASTFGKHPQIDVLFVAPHEQRQGIGRTLLRAFVQAVRTDAHIVSTSHPANRASRGWHRSLGFCPLPDRSLIRHLQAVLQANLKHGHVPEENGQPVKDTLNQIADRLHKTERERPVVVHPIHWPREDELLEQYIVA
jgi:GNAT superfamily N-acetyltransferase